MVGFRNHLLGSGLFWACIVVLAWYMTLYLIWTLSQSYFEWYGYVQTQKATIYTWHLGSVWFFGMVYNKDRLRGYFRVSCGLDTCTHITIWTPMKHVKVFKSEQQLKQERALALPGLFLDKFFSLIFRAPPLQPDATRDGHITQITVIQRLTPEGLPTGDRFFDFELRRFVYDAEKRNFFYGKQTEGVTFAKFVAAIGGLSSAASKKQKQAFGPNKITIPVPGRIAAIWAEFSKGFYVYQLFILLPWFFFDYYHMGLLTWTMCASGGIAIALANRNNKVMLASLVKVGKPVMVLRDGKWKSVAEKSLVPGDIIKVLPGPAPCDLVLVKGACTVDESMLTGESLPVQKSACSPDNEVYSADSHTHKKYTVYCGTVALNDGSSTEETAPLGYVTRTGGHTLKGEQVRSILYPAIIPFKFNTEVKVVMVILCFYAIAMFSINMGLLSGKPPYEAWYYGMYVVASSIPPLLPTVFVVSVQIASGRLRGKSIICSDPERILMAGKVRVCCFDKTGTLTKQGLDFRGFHDVNQDTGAFAPKFGQPADLPKLCTFGMASACSLAEITLTEVDAVTGVEIKKKQLIGNSVDVKMFQATGWSLKTDMATAITELTGPQGDKLKVLKRYEFDPAVVRMSVIAVDAEGKHYVFVKGSYEAIAHVCTRNMPADYDKLTTQYSKEGCYVLSLAVRPATEQEVSAIKNNEPLSRNSVESNLSCLGLIIFKNDLKPCTAPALADLRAGNVRCVMITGDNALTGGFIARECGLVPPNTKGIHGTIQKEQLVWHDDEGKPCDLPDGMMYKTTHDAAVASRGSLVAKCDGKANGQQVELYVNGMAFRYLKKNGYLRSLLPWIRVYARMQPDDKENCVNAHIEAGIITGMCGDGGNDCNALRAAHVGIALSDSDASVVSPFTDRNMSVRSVVDTLIEGRATLATSFSCYKFMIMYGQVETLNQTFNSYFAITFSEWAWIVLDGVFVVAVAYFLALTKPAQVLGKKRPTASLLGPITMTSVLGMSVMNFCLLLIALRVLFNEEWYACRVFDAESTPLTDWWALGDNYEAGVIFLVSGSQYLHAGVQFNFGGEFRANWLNNWTLAIGLAIFYSLIIVMLFSVSVFSCLFRVNCVDEYMIRGITISSVGPVNNWEHSTVLPDAFRIKLLVIILFNLAVACFWEKVVILGPVARWARTRWPREKPLQL